MDSVYLLWKHSGGSWFVLNGKLNFLRETVKSNNISERSNFKSIRGTKIFLKKYSRCKVFAVFLFLKMLSLFKYSRSVFLKSNLQKVIASDNFWGPRMKKKPMNY